jgi:NAD(P)H-dependent FMN reductase
MESNELPVPVIALSGSLRRGSFNTAVLEPARELQPEGVAIEVASIAAIPVFNEDTEAAGMPGPVAELRRRVYAADALPGVLRNTIDRLSRTDRSAPGVKPPLNSAERESAGNYGSLVRAFRHGPSATAPPAGLYLYLHQHAAPEPARGSDRRRAERARIS